MASITPIGQTGSRKYRARWRTPAGRERSRTFKRRVDAEQWLTSVESSKLSGGYVERSAGSIALGDWFAKWVATRRTTSGQMLRPKTRALYDHLYTRHIAPEFGDVLIRNITPSDVREWHGRLPGETTPAKCYRLLRAMLNTAVDDELITKNPCRIHGAGVERSPERPVPTGDEVWAFAEVIDHRWRALVLTSAFAGLRWGELMGLQRGDVYLDDATITVKRQVIEVGRDQIEGPPKSSAGFRTVALPMVLVPELREHLDRYVASDPKSRLFVGKTGATPRSSNFGAIWRKVRSQVGRDDVHFHDLRHFANTLAATAGASTKELMARLGHSTPAAALRYQHATLERDRAIADRMNSLMPARPACHPVSDPCHTSESLAQLRAVK
jgi:integrase